MITEGPIHTAWRLMTADVGSPDAFMTAVFYSTISTALERRVFYGQLDGRPWFVNNYTLLVGPAGVGKGQALREAKRVLGSYVMVTKDGTPIVNAATGEPRPLFFSLADTMTFEYIIQAMATEKRFFELPNDIKYQHTSAYVLLEELSSLLRIDKAEDVARLLLNLYDCERFEYKTRKSGSFTIQNGCFNLVAGTTVDFLTTAERKGMAGEGLMSRFMIVYADKRRSDKFMQSELSPEQKAAQTQIAQHLFKLSCLFGPLTISPATLEWLEAWWTAEQKHLAHFGDPKLDNYFTRRKAQVMKLAAAIHFAENLTLEVCEEAFEKASRFLRDLEEPLIRMLKAGGGRNLAYGVGERLISRITRQGPMTESEVINFLSTDLDLYAATNLLLMLRQANRLEQTTGKHGVLLWKLTNPQQPPPPTSPHASM